MTLSKVFSIQIDCSLNFYTSPSWFFPQGGGGGLRQFASSFMNSPDILPENNRKISITIDFALPEKKFQQESQHPPHVCISRYFTWATTPVISLDGENIRLHFQLGVKASSWCPKKYHCLISNRTKVICFIIRISSVL